MLWLKQFFTWWNGQTLNTRFHTWRHGEFVGKDEFGNSYYRARGGKIDKALDASPVAPGVLGDDDGMLRTGQHAGQRFDAGTRCHGCRRRSELAGCIECHCFEQVLHGY